eukprot:TRINITY_DN7772_c0_g1_i1.p1 TRINITY_DN7772_c0_g1~~TRINITY_DN7772_c0_g1_i1.p1  ORF type:complete len:333 (+),score=70.99 TRINITY_DN7772_c0_g1_i1:39-1037(+)
MSSQRNPAVINELKLHHLKASSNFSASSPSLSSPKSSHLKSHINHNALNSSQNIPTMIKYQAAFTGGSSTPRSAHHDEDDIRIHSPKISLRSLTKALVRNTSKKDLGSDDIKLSPKLIFNRKTSEPILIEAETARISRSHNNITSLTSSPLSDVSEQYSPKINRIISCDSIGGSQRDFSRAGFVKNAISFSYNSTAGIGSESKKKSEIQHRVLKSFKTNDNLTSLCTSYKIYSPEDPEGAVFRLLVMLISVPREDVEVNVIRDQARLCVLSGCSTSATLREDITSLLLQYREFCDSESLFSIFTSLYTSDLACRDNEIIQDIQSNLPVIPDI